MEDDQISLLDLPDEVLLEIINNLPEKNAVSQTCLKFYSLVCDSSKDPYPLEISNSELVDSETMASIAHTQRKFNNLTIDLCNLLIDDYLFERITVVIKTFGPRLKKFKLWSSMQARPSAINEKQFGFLLENMPLLEEFIFKNLYVEQSDEIDKEEFNLSNLKSLLLDFCYFDTPAVLLKIPKNVIRELTFTFQPIEELPYQEFFDRQANIMKLELFENEKIEFSHLKLRHLKISSNRDFSLMIQQQPDLRYLDFTITWTDDNTFEEVCKLEHLEVFKTLIDLISMREYKKIMNIPTLKELRIESHPPYNIQHLEELSLMKGLKLEKLTLIYNQRKISPEIIIQMSNNHHYLKHVEIINRSIAIIDTFLQNFPMLQSLFFDCYTNHGDLDDTLLISNEEIKHEHLTQLVVTDVNANKEENSIELLKVVKICVNLQRLMLSCLVKFTNEHLQEILNNHPAMTHLSVEADDAMEFNDETASIIAKHGKKLRHFRLKGFTICQFINYETLKELFRLQFPIIKLIEYSSNYNELIMKKSNTEDWHHGFKLMNHF